MQCLAVLPLLLATSVAGAGLPERLSRTGLDAAAVRAFEPRLREPQLVVVGKDRQLWVRFLLSGSYDRKRCDFEIFFHSVFRNVRVVCA